jgi:hypothetical protein
MRVFFDTTVLCSAILDLDGLSMHLLELALVGVIEPVITHEVVAEFDRSCRRGLRGIVLDDGDIARFCLLLSPMLDLERVRSVAIGRAMAPLFPILDVGLVRIVQAPVATPAIVTRMLDEHTLALKDPFDLHVVAAAVADGCRYLCTYNTRDLPNGLVVGGTEFVKPEHLHRILR